VLTVERNQTVQVIMNSGVVGGPHPFHLHGVCPFLFCPIS
jgi:FtsP/CotA-like multicopper oxidase with cupredoxin domain